MNRVISILKDVYGKPVFELKLFFIKILSITKTTSEHFNVYLLYIPLFRVIKSKNRFGINLLLFTWLFKIVFLPFYLFKVVHNNYQTKLLFGKKNFVEIMHSSEKKGIRIFNKNVYSYEILTPYSFPSSKFKG